jgi:hypothetical protein
MHEEQSKASADTNGPKIGPSGSGSLEDILNPQGDRESQASGPQSKRLNFAKIFGLVCALVFLLGMWQSYLNFEEKKALKAQEKNLADSRAIHNGHRAKVGTANFQTLPPFQSAEPPADGSSQAPPQPSQVPAVLPSPNKPQLVANPPQPPAFPVIPLQIEPAPDNPQAAPASSQDPPAAPPDEAPDSRPSESLPSSAERESDPGPGPAEERDLSFSEEDIAFFDDPAVSRTPMPGNQIPLDGALIIPEGDKHDEDSLGIKDFVERAGMEGALTARLLMNEDPLAKAFFEADFRRRQPDRSQVLLKTDGFYWLSVDGQRLYYCTIQGLTISEVKTGFYKDGSGTWKNF